MARYFELAAKRIGYVPMYVFKRFEGLLVRSGCWHRQKHPHPERFIDKCNAANMIDVDAWMGLHIDSHKRRRRLLRETIRSGPCE